MDEHTKLKRILASIFLRSSGRTCRIGYSNVFGWKCRRHNGKRSVYKRRYRIDPHDGCSIRVRRINGYDTRRRMISEYTVPALADSGARSPCSADMWC